MLSWNAPLPKGDKIINDLAEVPLECVLIEAYKNIKKFRHFVMQLTSGGRWGIIDPG